MRQKPSADARAEVSGISRATVVAIDRSWHMAVRSIGGAAKGAQRALDDLVRREFSGDVLEVVCFDAYDTRVDRAVPPALSWDESALGTNLQHAVLLANELLDPYPDATRHLLVLIGGEPTAHLEQGRSYFAYPLSPVTVRETLAALRQCRAARIDLTLLLISPDEHTHRFGDYLAQHEGVRVIEAASAALTELLREAYTRDRRPA